MKFANISRVFGANILRIASVCMINERIENLFLAIIYELFAILPCSSWHFVRLLFQRNRSIRMGECNERVRKKKISIIKKTDASHRRSVTMATPMRTTKITQLKIVATKRSPYSEMEWPFLFKTIPYWNDSNGLIK